MQYYTWKFHVAVILHETYIGKLNVTYNVTPSLFSFVVYCLFLLFLLLCYYCTISRQQCIFNQENLATEHNPIEVKWNLG